MTTERAVYVATLGALAVASVLALVVSGGGGHTAPSPGQGDFQTTADGTRYTVHPSELRQGCPAGMDCIPSIDDPRFQAAGEADWLAPSDQVIGVEIDGEAKAYPLRILNVHEVVNDELGSRPIAVTYCPLCRSGLVFSRSVDGRTLTFGVSGQLIDANLVLYDRQTETYWSQIRGEAVVGPLVPTTLRLHPSSITTWAQWREGHPDTRVLSRNTGIYPKATYGSNPYAAYANSSGVGFGVGSVDDRLGAKTLVYGLTVGGSSVAYSEEVVRSRDVINDEIDDVPVVVVEDPRDGGVSAFIRRAGNETVAFEASDDALVDGDGHRWSYGGEALEGSHAGTQLDRLQTHGFFWFAWSQFHPETRVYNASDARQPDDG